VGAIVINKTYSRLGHFEAWDFIVGTLMVGTFYGWDVLGLGCFGA
jgi:hypothetical protein